MFSGVIIVNPPKSSTNQTKLAKQTKVSVFGYYKPVLQVRKEFFISFFPEEEEDAWANIDAVVFIFAISEGKDKYMDPHILYYLK